MSSPSQDKHSKAAPKRVCLAKIATAHGVKGAVKLHVYATDPFLMDGKALYTGENADEQLRLTLLHPHGKYWLAEIKGVNDREAAAALRHTELWMDRDQLPDTEEGEFYHTDLIDLRAIDRDDRPFGRVTGLENYGAGDLLEIRPDSGESFYVPFTKDHVPEVNLDQGVIRIYPPVMDDTEDS